MADGRVIPMISTRVTSSTNTLYDGLACECGSAWFVATVAFGPRVSGGRSVTGYGLDVKCARCGREVSPL